MIPKTKAAVQTESIKLIEEPDWQHLLANAITDSRTLLQRLQLPLEQLPALQRAQQDFNLRVPEPYLRRIEVGNPEDPLLLQILPQARESLQVPGYVSDPLQESAANQQQGIIHKYRGRVLLIISGGCAINCRYCFRRHFPYQQNQLGKAQWQQALNYLDSDASIDEVIFSGGDPLAASDERLSGMFRDLQAIPHLRRLRLHSRLPVVIPQRVTGGLLSALQSNRLQTVLVNHVNHPRELDQQVIDAMTALKNSGVTLLNQSVLLRRVNDDSATLKALSEQLFSAGILPYYLHMLDPVAGASHFAIGESRARQLVGELTDQLPGYLVPKLVRELAGASAKVPLMPLLGNPGTR